MYFELPSHLNHSLQITVLYDVLLLQLFKYWHWKFI